MQLSVIGGKRCRAREADALDRGFGGYLWECRMDPALLEVRGIRFQERTLSPTSNPLASPSHDKGVTRVEPYQCN